MAEKNWEDYAWWVTAALAVVALVVALYAWDVLNG